MGYFSNGSEGMDYENRYCSRCIHEKPGDGGCPIMLLHLLYNYEECNKPSSFLNVLIPRSEEHCGNDQCSMFIPTPESEAAE